MNNIKVIRHEVKNEYGWSRMHKESILHGIRVGKERVRKLMLQHGIRAKHKHTLCVSDHKHFDYSFSLHDSQSNLKVGKEYGGRNSPQRSQLNIDL